MHIEGPYNITKLYNDAIKNGAGFSPIAICIIDKFEEGENLAFQVSTIFSELAKEVTREELLLDGLPVKTHFHPDKHIYILDTEIIEQKSSRIKFIGYNPFEKKNIISIKDFVEKDVEEQYTTARGFQARPLTFEVYREFLHD